MVDICPGSGNGEGQMVLHYASQDGDEESVRCQTCGREWTWRRGLDDPREAFVAILAHWGKTE